MKYGLFSFLILLFCSVASAQTLLVSDVDDTIKLSHVHSYKDMIYYALDDSSRFMGMSDLYNGIVKDNPDIQVVYLSKAPKWIMQRRHQSFLKKGKFPAGRYIGRSDLAGNSHKIENLRALLKEFQPKKVILIGDNGEADAEIYHQISQEFAAAGIQFCQFIRIVYSKSLWSPAQFNLNPGQVGFVTPVEISLDLQMHGLLSASSVQGLLDAKLDDLTDAKLKEKNGEYAFPYFVNCGDFRWQWESRIAEFPELVDLKTRILARCGLQP